MRHNIKAAIRTTGKKSIVKNLRNQGYIPAIVYGNKKDPIAITINAREFRKEFSHISESSLIDLEIENDTTRSVLIKDFEEDLVKGRIIHMDFLEIEAGKMLTTNVEVSLTGTPVGVRQGGILEHFLHEVEIECYPKDLPEILEVSVDELNISDSLHVSDLPQLKGVQYKNSPTQVVLQVSSPKLVSLEPDTEEITEVETVSDDSQSESESE